MSFPYVPAIGLMILLLGSCRPADPSPEPAPAGQRTVPVRTAVVLPSSTVSGIRATGLIGSSAEARPSFKTGGVIRRLLVDEGDLVREGQLLGSLDLTEIGAQAAQARAALDMAERDLSRARNLFRDSVATREQLQNAETAVEIASRNVEIAGFNRTWSELRAPVTGRVLRKLMNEGEITGPGNPVYVLAGTGVSDWVLTIGLTDRDWVRVKEGDPVRVRLDAWPDQELSGRIHRLAPVADPGTGTFPVEIRLETTARKLAVGMIASAVIQPAGGEPCLEIPLEALVGSEGASGRVFLLDGNRARTREVTLDRLAGDRVRILGGLAEGDTVITAGAAYLSDGQEVILR